MTTLVKCTSGKAMMNLCQDHGEGIFPVLEWIVSWLLAIWTCSITFHILISITSSEFVVVSGCHIIITMFVKINYSIKYTPISLSMFMFYLIYFCF